MTPSCPRQQGPYAINRVLQDHNFLCQSKTSFNYEPLNYTQKEIRLLQILPDRDCVSALAPAEFPQIRCRLYRAPLRTGHISLSYRWAKTDPMKRIYVNEQQFEVSLHLWNFLNVARRKLKALDSLWIDAICIDQNNVEEKNHQVPLMGEIYSNSKLVITWLGTSCPGARHVRFNRDACKPSEANSVVSKPTTNGYCLKKKALDNVCQNEDGLVDFFENEYWSRAWIVQEILLAQKGYVLVGVDELSWQEILSCWKSIAHENGTEPGLSIAAQRRIRNSHFKNLAEAMSSDDQPYVSVLAGEKWHWRDLLKGYGEQECFDFHDRVYALRSLALESDKITVDYNIGREELFFTALMACGSDKCLCIASHLLKVLGLENSLPMSKTWTSISPPSDYTSQILSTSNLQGCFKNGVSRVDELFAVGDQMAFSADDKIGHFLTLEFNLLECTLITPHQASTDQSVSSESCLLDIPEQWKAERGRILPLASFGLPACLLLRRSVSSREWYCAAIQFLDEEGHTSHHEVLVESLFSGFSVRFEREQKKWYLELTRSALLTMLAFGKQHRLCDSLCSGKYDFFQCSIE